MNGNTRLRLPREGLVKGVVLIALAALGAMAFIGPAGLLAWSENSRLLKQREAEIDQLQAERDVLRNRVDLLDPKHADPDLVGELLRKNLNVAHPDEIVVARP
jgi:cell division protein FtsB